MITSITNFLIGCVVFILCTSSIVLIMIGVHELGYSREAEFFIHMPLILWTTFLHCYFLVKSGRAGE